MTVLVRFKLEDFVYLCRIQSFIPSDSVFAAEATSVHQLERCSARYFNSSGYCYHFAFELFKQPLAHRPRHLALLAK